MEIADADRIKHRQIPFNPLHPDSNQAQTAALFLADVEGIGRAVPLSATLLSVSYDVGKTTLCEIEAALDELGLHIDNNLFYRIKRAIYHYAEDTLRANCDCPRGRSNCTKKVFAMRYEAIEHGCRDQRPEHWRRYL